MLAPLPLGRFVNPRKVCREPRPGVLACAQPDDTEDWRQETSNDGNSMKWYERQLAAVHKYGSMGSEFAYQKSHAPRIANQILITSFQLKAVSDGRSDNPVALVSIYNRTYDILVTMERPGPYSDSNESKYPTWGKRKDIGMSF